MLVQRSPSARTLVLRLAAAMLCALAGSSVAGARVQKPPAGEVRALWVTRATLGSPTAIAQLVRTAQEGGFNTLIVQVRGRGDAYYVSALEPRAAELVSRPDFDPLAHTLRLAHDAGLRVHAWISVNLVSSAFELPASRQHLVYRQPDWLMVPRELGAEMIALDPRSPEYVGRIARWIRPRTNDIEGLYLSPLNPAAVTHVANVVTDLVQHYAVDGVHLDYARFPNEAFDYSRTALQQFKLAIGPGLTELERAAAEARETIDPLAYPTLFQDRWDAFRRSRTTAMMMRLRTAVKAARPEVIVSAAVVPDLTQAYEARFQDWRTWLDQGLIDVLCPMAYTKDVEVFEKQIAVALDFAGDRPVWAGVGAYRLTTAEILEHIAAARRLKASGIILFSYESLITPPNSAASLAALARAAFGGRL